MALHWRPLHQASVWYSRLFKTGYSVGLDLQGAGIDDPDAVIKMYFDCQSAMNCTRYCRPEIDKLLEEQSAEAWPAKRRQIVWEIECRLIRDVARSIIMHGKGATCWQSHVEGWVLREYSIFNNWRLDQVWLER